MTTPNTNTLWVGANIKRRDGVDKVTGQGLFTSDITLPGMLYAKILRSPHPHARIKSIDTSEALAIRGVRAVATHEHCPKKPYNGSAPMFTTLPTQLRVLDQFVLTDVARFVGDEVAAVAADTPEIAEQAASAIKVEYEILPFVLDPFDALKDSAPELHPGKGVTPEGRNIPGEKAHLSFGIGKESAVQEMEAAFAACDCVIEEQFRLPVVKQVQLETMSAVAACAGDGKVTVYSTSQTPHLARYIIAGALDIPASKIRVLAPPYIGGGFGVRIGLSAKAELIAVLLAKLSGKPVKVCFDREEDFRGTDTRHGGLATVRLGAMKDGTFKALDMGMVLAGGAYCSFSVEVPGVGGAMALSLYSIPKTRYCGYTVYTNQTPAGAFRGFGNPQGNFALERAVDIMADRLGLDPLALRKANLTRPGQEWLLPYPCLSSAIDDCMEQGARSIGWERRNSFDNSGPVKRGIGVAVGVHVSNSWPFCVDYDNAYVVIQSDGSLHLAAGVPEIGTGTSTSLPQIAAEAYGADLNDIHFSYADTESTPFSIGAHASRSLYAVGLSVKAAAEDARARTLEYAAGLMAAEPEQLDIVNGILCLKGQGARPGSLEDMIKGKSNACRLAELCYHAHVHNRQFIGVGRMIPPNSPPWHACFADLSVDTETGQITVHKLVGAHDVGVAVNPMIVEGQIEGGLIQGLGYALTEEITYKSDGRQNNDNLHTYMVPTFNDIPEIDSIIVSCSDPQGPYGAKGAGECSLVSPASALANALSSALGLCVNQIPMTPERVLALVSNTARPFV